MIMRRVLVVGCAGAGKTWFSHRLAEITGLPVIGLDRAYWRPGWSEPDRETWRTQVNALAALDQWIMDGNYGGTLDLRLARADTVYVLDMPRALCLTRVLRRTARHWGRSRPDMTPGCPERLDGPFFHYIWTYDRIHRPRLLEALEPFDGDHVHLSTAKEARAHLDHLAESLS